MTQDQTIGVAIVLSLGAVTAITIAIGLWLKAQNQDPKDQD